MRKLLWLDDIRNPFLDDWLLKYVPEFSDKTEDVTWVKNFNEFKNYIEINGIPTHISFDHDIASYDDSGNELTGYDALKFVLDYVLDNNLEVPKICIHSANPIGAKNIESYYNNFIKFYKRN